MYKYSRSSFSIFTRTVKVGYVSQDVCVRACGYYEEVAAVTDLRKLTTLVGWDPIHLCTVNKYIWLRTRQYTAAAQEVWPVFVTPYILRLAIRVQL